MRWYVGVSCVGGGWCDAFGRHVCVTLVRLMGLVRLAYLVRLVRLVCVCVRVSVCPCECVCVCLVFVLCVLCGVCVVCVVRVVHACLTHVCVLVSVGVMQTVRTLCSSTWRLVPPWWSHPRHQGGCRPGPMAAQVPLAKSVEAAAPHACFNIAPDLKLHPICYWTWPLHARERPHACYNMS